jgi:SnoaL-like protein
MLSLQQISDHIEIEQQMVAYSTAIDTRNWDGLDQIFTPDAYIDYRSVGGIDGRYPEVKAWLKKALAPFPNYYHMLGNLSLKVEGDQAQSKVICFNPMKIALPGGKTQVMFVGIWYLDQWLRTAQGWRMTQRVEEKCFDFNVPGGLDAGN